MSAKKPEPAPDLLPRPEPELNQIALDIHHGRIWTDRHCQSPHDIQSCFMILAFCDEGHIPNNCGMIFEYVHKAGPLSCNGMPCFFSMRMLSTEDTKKVLAKIGKLREAEAAALTTSQSA